MQAPVPTTGVTRSRKSKRLIKSLSLLAIAFYGFAFLGSRDLEGQPAPKPRAVWVWQPQEIASAVKDSTARTSFFEQAKAHNMGVLFLNPNDLLDPEPLPPTDVRHLERSEIAVFLREAHQQGFKVEALQGDPEFARPEHHDKALDRLRRTLSYNKTVPQESRWDGMQWDIEPYTLPEFKTPEGRQSLMAGFLTLADKMRTMVQAEQEDFTLGFAMPFWMDSPEQDVQWNGNTKPATFHLYDLLKSMPNAYVALMSYRDNAEQTKEVASQEISYSQKHAPNVKLWVGQELNELPGEPPVVTYFDNGFENFNAAATELEKGYADEPVVAGLAIHDWKGYKVLKEKGQVR